MLFLDILSVYFVVIIPVLALVIVFAIFNSIIEKYSEPKQVCSETTDKEIKLQFGVIPKTSKIRTPKMKSTRRGG